MVQGTVLWRSKCTINQFHHTGGNSPRRGMGSPREPCLKFLKTSENSLCWLNIQLGTSNTQSIPPETVWQVGIGATSFLDYTATDSANQLLADWHANVWLISQSVLRLFTWVSLHTCIMYMETMIIEKYLYVYLLRSLLYMMQNGAYIHRFIGSDQLWPGHHLKQPAKPIWCG